MSLSHVYSSTIYGLDGLLVDIEVDVTPGGDKSSLIIVGLPDAVVKESKDRVLTGIKNSGYSKLQFVGTVNLAPSSLKKEGSTYDLPIALGIISSLGHLKRSHLKDYLIVGELGLSGVVRPVKGALCTALLAKELGKKGIILPQENAFEAHAVPDLEVIPVSYLNEAVDFLNEPDNFISKHKNTERFCFSTPKAEVDFADIKGQESAKRAMEIVAAGNHNILFSGPPGSGKTMLSKALIGILPPLHVHEALECTKIHSISGKLKSGESIMLSRPFRSPHNTVSHVGLIGGGTHPVPGEISCAHNGVLFLDELAEFPRKTLESLRQPMEDKRITVSRARGSYTFPANFICVGAMNPCPCGYQGHPDIPCKDSSAAIQRYQSGISGPIRDRFDLHVEVQALRYSELLKPAEAENSQTVLERVLKARKIQDDRLGAGRTNSLLAGKELKKHCKLSSESQEMLKDAIQNMGFSARAFDKILRVARTIADLAGTENIQEEHLFESLSYQQRKHESLSDLSLV